MNDTSIGSTPRQSIGDAAIQPRQKLSAHSRIARKR